MSNNLSNGVTDGKYYNRLEPNQNANQPSLLYNGNYIKPNDVFSKISSILPQNNNKTPLNNRTIGQTYTTYINIDSKNRLESNMNEYDDNVIVLPNNSIIFENGNDEITIRIPNHDFSIGDLIAIRNYTSYYIKSKRIAFLNKKSQYIILKVNHNTSYSGLINNFDSSLFVPVSNISTLIDPNTNVNNQSNKIFYKLINPPRKYFVEISGFTNNQSNILFRYLNGIQMMTLFYTLKNGQFVEEDDLFGIELPVISDISHIYADIITINFLSIYGLPINLINSGTPTSDQQLLEYHAITNVDSNNIKFSINITAVINNLIDTQNEFEIYKIIGIAKGYPDSNNYTIDLDKIFNNVIQIKLLSTSFPNSIPILDSYNNSFKWLFLEDSYPNEISVPIGTYDNTELKNQLEELTRIDNKYLLFDFNKSNNITTISGFKDITVFNIDESIKFFDTLFTAKFAFQLTNDFSAIVGFPVNKYDPKNDTLYFYFTENSHTRISSNFPKLNEGLYLAKYTSNNNIVFQYVPDRKMITLFYRTKNIYPTTTSVTENIIINTSTNLDRAFISNNKVDLANHRLNVNDILITDRFNNNNYVYVYKITEIINSNSFLVEIASNIKIIYDSLIINFSKDPNNSVYWLDQILNTDPINNNTLSITNIEQIGNEQTYLRLKINENNLELGQSIKINGSNAIITNLVNFAQENIATNENSLLLLVRLDNQIEIQNIVYISIPIKIKLFFNYENSIGKILGFSNVGNITSITDYQYIVQNTENYPNNYIPILNLPIINTPDYPYFYICSNVLQFYKNTYPVEYVFAKVRWYNYKNNTENKDDKMIYDSFAISNNIYQEPIASLNIIDFKFVKPDGTLVNFFGQNHSFTLEITEVAFQPVETDINTKTNTTLYTRQIN